MGAPSLEELLQFAVTIARRAGDHTIAYFNKNIAVEYKDDNSPVTRADREAEEIVREQILAKYPTHSILGEEAGILNNDPDYQWVIDPIDGTKSFIHGVPLYTTLIGLQIKGRPSVGVIYAPALGEMVAAATGLGCRLNGQSCAVSETSELKNALICCSDVTMAVDRSDAFMTLARRCNYARTWGDGYGYLLVATGRAEIMVDPAMNPWDVCALIPVITEAGGHCSSWKGESTIHGGDLYACNAALAPQVAGILSGG